jgi:hypothetical protein
MRRTAGPDNLNDDWIRTVIFFAPLLYLDPGTGSLLIQAIVAAVLSILYFTKQFWMNLFARISRKARRKDDGSDEESGSS